MKLVGVTSIQVADEVFVAAAPPLAAAVIGDPARWRRWWPDLRLAVTEDRGEQGIRWQVGGPVTGTMEIWNEAVLDGFVLHYFLHAEPTRALPDDPRARADALASENKQRRVAGKEMSFECKRILEDGRGVGGPAVGSPAGSGVA
ncbi:hypothetical protein IA539_02395 [Gordonia sp. zg691]|uniref:Polyketide cyclase / dehydrase and lipid transport n=1 Tax=Gordonia jinghuaiqii TaxID=2758710 RepID=A0A7D7LTF2_9ACTN|nr:hypothetical protein [Gordonia jinghuaiqii]MBD0860062.1 hypothetical protein [Gordonia jinghuaiqii]MCR5977229.1 hypothetical protein [Gordonia jinghuaiqii]QMT00175.1 hypothetical protein H1R19_14695 [Gordonia jinghuaiqii]